MLINFPLRVLFCRVSQNLLLSVNISVENSDGGKEQKAPEGREMISEQTNNHLEDV